MSRASYHHGNLREALIEAGLSLIRQKGARGLSLRTVAQKAGVSPAAPYRHFGSLTELLAAIAQQGFDALRGALADALGDRSLAALSPLERAGLGYLRFSRAHPAHLRLMFSSRLAPKARPKELSVAGRAAFDVLVQAIEASREAGHIPPRTDVALLAATAWAFIHGLSLLLLDEHLKPKDFGRKDPEDLVRACQIIFREGWSSGSLRSA